ncbi:MAG: hypothetical protein EAZ77_05660 [Nostocales cyanobacterium]|nr:MAG: hypothetical protein EAZ77_05660 [Nostocales cyanobacterium]
MNSNSQSANSPDTYSQRLADIVGTAIALVTLTLPVFIISHYSSPEVRNYQQYLISNLPRRGGINQMYQPQKLNNQRTDFKLPSKGNNSQ